MNITIKATKLTRPAITFEEIIQPDGGYAPGRATWSAILFSADLNPFEVCKFHDQVALVVDKLGDELWLLSNANIAVSPGSKVNKQGVADNDFVVIFTQAKRVSLNTSAPSCAAS